MWKSQFLLNYLHSISTLLAVHKVGQNLQVWLQNKKVHVFCLIEYIMYTSMYGKIMSDIIHQWSWNVFPLWHLYHSCASDGGIIGHLVKNWTYTSVSRMDIRPINFFARFIPGKEKELEWGANHCLLVLRSKNSWYFAFNVGYSISSFVSEA
jgi:hypothetical protein